ncbi:putative hydrolase [Lachnellula suecica]|uniref:Putative hydrolase n=1 Tax=Lachnellula suecica TaxID=602035 RepID=A0A8T9BYM8_9HELO|nr:putative hydrolase [Lachnellula suecica]
MPPSTIVNSEDGIQWYIEQQGSGPHLILIPSGEGDCESFAKIAAFLARDFTVTTFDMPGMSRTTCPPSAVADVTAPLLAKQIVGLMDELKIQVATFYGCSSAGLAALSLVANHPERVQSAIVHEVPLHFLPDLEKLSKKDDAEIIIACRQIFATTFNKDPAAWEALGCEFHARLERNYVTWLRSYTRLVPEELSNEDLTRRPITWTIGALTAAGAFFDNVVTATKAGIEIGTLQSKHFPQVSIPDVLAAHIKSSALKYI